MKLQIHHFEMCVSDPEKVIGILKDQFGFKIVGKRITRICNQIVLQTGKKIFIITHRKSSVSHSNATHAPHSHSEKLLHSEYWTVFCCEESSKQSSHPDSVFNIAIQVHKLEKVVEHLRKIGCTLLQDITTVESPEGSVKYAILKSICGNIVHTLVDKDGYHGHFLPEFDSTQDNSVELDSEYDCHFRLTSHFDHVSIACRAGETDKLIDWYSQAFGMRRFLTNREDTEDEGLVIGGEVGMRLKVMEFWSCSETGIGSTPCSLAEEDYWEPLKIVIVESLPNTTNTQIDVFLRGHCGPGVQHVGLYSANIIDTVQKMTANGVKFRRPPPAYYTEIGQLNAILSVGEDLENLQKCGILLDSEADVLDDSTEEKYLMQIFTHPIFDRDTFFLEVIQRKGALGFGVGNVTALARSINAYNLDKLKDPSEMNNNVKS